MNKKIFYGIIIVLLLMIFSFLLGAKSQGIPQALVWQPEGADCAFMDFGCDEDKASTEDANNAENESELLFGAYDPAGLLSDSDKIKVDHIYYSWLAFDDADFVKRTEDAHAKGRDIFLTIEPWAKDGSPDLLSDIVGGVYDTNINSICSAVGKSPSKVYLSFAHEMDHDLTVRYPWSGQDAASFIKSYQYFVNKCRSLSGSALYVYVPVGDKKALEYWPGAEYSDMVGFPVYSFPDFDLKYYASARTFAQATVEKYDRLATLGKPLVIAELGVAGDDARKTKWISDMYASLPNFPKLQMVLFFNAMDHVGVWGADLPTPDWRVTSEMLK